MGFAKAASALLGGIAPRVTDTYTNAANATAGYARGLGDAVQAPVDQTIASHNDFLRQTGAPTSALEHSAPIGNTAYGLEGYIPASTMQREGAAFSSAAQMLPSDALARGQQAASASLNDTTTIAKLQSDLAKIAATRPQVYQQMLNTLSEMGYRQGELNLGQQRVNVSEQSLQLRQAYDKASLQFRYAGLKLSNQKFAFDVQQAMAKGQMPDSALSGKYGYIVDSYGNPILNGKGRRIPVVRAGKGKGGLPGAGGDLASKLGLSQNEYFSWLGKAGKDAHYYWGQGSTWKQALGQLVVLGIPKPIAIKALRNQGYMPGVRGAPPISPGEGGGNPPGAKTGGGGNAGGFLPAGVDFSYDRQDQGRDIQARPGQAITAPGSGYVVRIGSDPGGGGGHFGPHYPIVYFTSGPYEGRYVYIGHTVSALRTGQRFGPGAVLSHTQYSGPLNGGAPDGWAEIGYAPGGSPGVFGQQVPF